MWTKLTFGSPAGGCICSVQWTVTETRSTSICWKREIVRRPKRFSRRLYRIRTIALHTCCVWTGAGSTLQQFGICGRKGAGTQKCRRRTKRYANNRIESDHRHVKQRLRAMQGPRTMPTAQRVIQGIEAVHMIRKAQLLGCKKTNLATISIAFALLLKIA